jgi:4-hydroxy-tetrahydrodipicolinate synthase
MRSAKLGCPLRGIIVPLVTPLLEQETLDIEGLERLLIRVLDGGVHGLFVLGTTGEGPSLSYRLRREMIERTCRLTDGRVPVLVAITDTSMTEALSLAYKAQEEGAHAVVYAGPFYFPIAQAELIRHVETLASLSPLPLFLYNIPDHTHVNFELPTVKALAEHPRILGFKDSSGDLLYFQQVVDAVRDNSAFSVLMGPEELLAGAMLHGAHGGVNGGANLFPSLYVRLYEAAIAQAHDEVDRLNRIVQEVSDRVYAGGYLRGLKCALSLSGICSGIMAEPQRECADEQREAISAHLRHLHRVAS